MRYPTSVRLLSLPRNWEIIWGYYLSCWFCFKEKGSMSLRKTSLSCKGSKSPIWMFSRCTYILKGQRKHLLTTTYFLKKIFLKGGQGSLSLFLLQRKLIFLSFSICIYPFRGDCRKEVVCPVKCYKTSLRSTWQDVMTLVKATLAEGENRETDRWVEGRNVRLL